MADEAMITPQEAIDRILRLPAGDAEDDEYNSGWDSGITAAKEIARTAHPDAEEGTPTEAELHTRDHLAALVEETERQLDADGVEPGEETDAFKAAASLLDRPPRGGFKPRFVNATGRYFLVAVFSRNVRDDTEQLRESRRRPAEQLAAELREAAKAGFVAGDFQVAEPDAIATPRYPAGNTLTPATAEECTIGPMAVPVIRQLLRALSSRDPAVTKTARDRATALLGTAG